MVWRKHAKGRGHRAVRVRMNRIEKFTKGRACDFEDPSAEEGA